MRSQFLLVPAALIASASAYGQESVKYLTVEQALARLFPGATFVEQELSLTQKQMDALLKVANGSVPSWKITGWKVSTGGWAFLDQVPGRDDAIQYVVGLNPDGSIKGVEILECLPNYNGITNADWLAQFVGRRQDVQDVAKDIDIVSGATLSSEHIAKGVRRVLIAYAMFFTAPS